ncbi:MAG: DUF427 domain-containing protein, partial [Chloroflexota bacterium]
TGHLPVYYFPASDVDMAFLEATDHTTHCPYKGDASYWTMKAGGQVTENSVWSYQSPIDSMLGIQGYFAFYWNKVDHWYEEEEEVFVHPRDPYKRIDVVPSSRHVQVVVGGQTVADSHQPFLLFETGLPVRYYLPQADVRMDLLEATTSQSRCPYKGIASYWSVKLDDQSFDNIVWGYPDPIPECPKIKDLVCFFNEKVDLYVDGVLQPVPQTPWS